MNEYYRHLSVSETLFGWFALVYACAVAGLSVYGYAGSILGFFAPLFP